MFRRLSLAFCVMLFFEWFAAFARSLLEFHPKHSSESETQKKKQKRSVNCQLTEIPKLKIDLPRGVLLLLLPFVFQIYPKSSYFILIWIDNCWGNAPWPEHNTAVADFCWIKNVFRSRKRPSDIGQSKHTERETANCEVRAGRTAEGIRNTVGTLTSTTTRLTEKILSRFQFIKEWRKSHREISFISHWAYNRVGTLKVIVKAELTPKSLQ